MQNLDDDGIVHHMHFAGLGALVGDEVDLVRAVGVVHAAAEPFFNLLAQVGCQGFTARTDESRRFDMGVVPAEMLRDFRQGARIAAHDVGLVATQDLGEFRGWRPGPNGMMGEEATTVEKPQ